jgi:o-succinylbenzoate---CoA ligase
MAEPLALLTQRLAEGWDVMGDRPSVLQLSMQQFDFLTQFSTSPTLLLLESDSVSFLASFLAACAAGCRVVLGNPHWGTAERQQALSLTQPDLIWDDTTVFPVLRSAFSLDCQPLAFSQTEVFSIQDGQDDHPTRKLIQDGQDADSTRNLSSCQILIATGGSSGQIRFATHTWETLSAAVWGFRQHFQIDRVNSCCVLPLYHVSGLMQFMRSFLTGGKLALYPFKELETGELPNFDPADFFLSLVPTQLQRLLQAERSDWLAAFRAVLLGGAPAWADLLEQAKRSRIPLAPTYGMTETAAQIATLKPTEFWQGETNCGRVLPHAQVTIRDQQGYPLAPNQIGRITIQSPSLTLGYFPNYFEAPTEFQTDDLGYVDDRGYLTVVGRNSSKIITGGENVFPAEVEAVIRSTRSIADVCVFGLPDRHWGEVVTAVYVPLEPQISLTELRSFLTKTLSNYKQPKHWIAVKQLPRNAQGKLNYAQLKAIAMQHLAEQNQANF